MAEKSVKNTIDTEYGFVVDAQDEENDHENTASRVWKEEITERGLRLGQERAVEFWRNAIREVIRT